MNKLRFLLAFAIASICSVYSAWARTAPTMPETLALESGNVYYLYNVGCDRFLSFETSTGNGYPWARTDQGKAVKISLVNGTQYNIMFVDGDRYWYSYESELFSVKSSDPNMDSYRFTVAEVEGGYTIQRVYYANREHFIGYDGRNGDRIYANLTEGNIAWQLMDADEAARFIAKRNLYRALEANTGFNIDEYEAVYENESSTNAQLQAAADKLNNAYSITGSYTTKSWSDYPILFSSPNSDWKTYNNDYFSSPQIKDGGRTTLVATVVTDEDATLVYEARGLWNKVYLDDELVAYNNNGQAVESGQNHYVEMGPGKHVIKWVFENDGSSNASGYLYNVGIEKTPTITVSLLEPGSLGTEVLKNTDHIQNVRKLVVSGPMNSDDWERIMMMTSLFALDLTNAEITEIPKEQLSSYRHSSNLSFFHEVKLPTMLKTIGEYAFYRTPLDHITFPDGLETIGEYAFKYTRIKTAILPETVTLVGEGAFSYNQSLEEVVWPASARTIPYSCFLECKGLQPFEIPEGVISIEWSAFHNCYSYRTSIPASVTSIGTYAFSRCNLDNVVIRENVSVSSEAFEYCNLKTIEFPTSMYSAPSRVVQYCTSMTDIYLKSPTMVSPNDILKGCDKNILTVHVPDYLVNTYKQDGYWYDYNIVGFSTADINEWQIFKPLNLLAGQRFEGSPVVRVRGQGTLSITGNDAMGISDFYTERNGNDLSMSSKVISSCENITIAGKYQMGYYTSKNRWYFISLPFDTKVSDIECPASFAIRYYDGANRAENGTGGNWKNYSKDDVIPAGTGFIFQTSKDVWSSFKAQDNETKQYVFSNREFVKSLAENSSESTANKGWNLVGNPWLSYYNIHKLNFTAPITVWNVNNRNYTAYSIIDDDYAIEPGQAFFVQCPDEVNSISFPIDGRQLTSVIESQNGARATAPSERRLIDVELSDGELTDKTRFVMNPQAEMGYELNRDASKFMSMDAAVPQIYSIENGEQLAINERPLDAGSVQLGFRVSVDGEYTISVPRNSFANLVLVDHETGIETLLANDVRYTFTASAGTNDSRFELRVGGTVVTEITNVKQDDAKANRYFNLNGQNVIPRQRASML